MAVFLDLQHYLGLAALFRDCSINWWNTLEAQNASALVFTFIAEMDHVCMIYQRYKSNLLPAPLPIISPQSVRLLESVLDGKYSASMHCSMHVSHQDFHKNLAHTNEVISLPLHKLAVCRSDLGAWSRRIPRMRGTYDAKITSSRDSSKILYSKVTRHRRRQDQ